MMYRIRDLYRPVQPSARFSEAVSYCEQYPDERLKDYIFCYWELNSKDRLPNQFEYTVAADGCIDIFWSRSNTQESFVMGVTDRYARFSLGRAFTYGGIRFLPSAFPLLFRIDASELTDQVIELSSICRSLSDHISHNDVGQPLSELRLGLDRFFLSFISNADPNTDTRLVNSLVSILKSNGTQRVTSDAATGISQRQLRRIFHQHIGETPKTFARIVRFQKLLQVSCTSKSMPAEKVYHDFGYYDQAHFIKEFKRFYGCTPGQML